MLPVIEAPVAVKNPVLETLNGAVVDTALPAQILLVSVDESATMVCPDPSLIDPAASSDALLPVRVLAESVHPLTFPTDAVMFVAVISPVIVALVAKTEPVLVTLNGAEEGVVEPAYIEISSACGVETKPTVLVPLPPVSALADNIHPAISPYVDVIDAEVICPLISALVAVIFPRLVTWNGAADAVAFPANIAMLEELGTEMIPTVLVPEPPTRPLEESVHPPTSPVDAVIC
jgi:hypothetical protein